MSLTATAATAASKLMASLGALFASWVLVTAAAGPVLLV